MHTAVPQLKYLAVYSTVFAKSCTRNFNIEEWLLTIEINDEICLRGVVNQIQDRNAAKVREAFKSYLFFVSALPGAVSKKEKEKPPPLDIITIYCGLMRSVIEYAAVVHAGLQQYPTSALEKNVQNRAFSMT